MVENKALKYSKVGNNSNKTSNKIKSSNSTFNEIQ